MKRTVVTKIHSSDATLSHLGAPTFFFFCVMSCRVENLIIMSAQPVLKISGGE